MRARGCQAGVGHHLVLFRLLHRLLTEHSTITAHAPQRGGAYQPRVQTLGTAPDTSTRSEGTPPIGKCGLHVRSILRRRSFRTHPRSRTFPGLHPSLVGVAPLEREREGPVKTEPDAGLNPSDDINRPLRRGLRRPMGWTSTVHRLNKQ